MRKKGKKRLNRRTIARRDNTKRHASLDNENNKT